MFHLTQINEDGDKLEFEPNNTASGTVRGGVTIRHESAVWVFTPEEWMQLTDWFGV